MLFYTTYNMQQEFLDSIKETDRIICMVGAKGSGKTYRFLCTLKYFLKNNIYNEYHLVLPAFKHEQTDQYKFLKDKKLQKNVFIYPYYVDEIGKELLLKQEKKKQKILLAIDDGTHMASELISSDKIGEICTTSRHCKITFMIMLHASKKVIPPMVRANVDFLFIFNVTNAKLLENIYEEFFSMMPDFQNFKDFKHYFNEVMKQATKPKKNAIFLSTIEQQYDYLVCNWND